MSDPVPPTDSSPSVPERENLPPVEQPSAGFIIQLFVIPGLIVLVIVLLWLGFSWLAQSGTRPEEIVRQMRQNRANSWQLASNFSEELLQNDAHRQNPALAKEVAQFLDELLEKPLPPRDGKDLGGAHPRSQEVKRRGYLCKVLGEFKLPDIVAPVLVRAASNHDNDDELVVRLAALEAIALLIENTAIKGENAPPKILALLLASSENEDRKIASRAAFGLAALRQQEATERLVAMLDEAQHVDVHYNVATGLARLGKVESVEILEEMLDPTNDRGLADESSPSKQERKRLRILLNGLRATSVLAEENPQANLERLRQAVEQLLASEDNLTIHIEAKKTLRALANRANTS